MKIIDVHTHIFPPEIIADRSTIARHEPGFGGLYGPPQARMTTAEQLLEAMARGGITQSVTLGFPFVDAGLRHACNEYVLESAGRSDDRLLPFGLVSPDDGEDAIPEMERLASQGVLGFGEFMPQYQSATLNTPNMDRIVQTAQALGKPLMIHVCEQLGHAYAGKAGPGPTEAWQLAMRHPQARLVFSHWGGGLVYYETMPEIHAALQNAYYDSAALLYLYDDRAFHMGAELARERLLFGTDYPLIDQRRFVHHVQSLGLDEDTLQAFMYGNAASLLGLMLEPEELP